MTLAVAAPDDHASPKRERMMSLHDGLVYGHAAFATIALLVGIFALARVKLVEIYALSTFAMTTLVAAAVAVGWSQFAYTERIAFVALIALALFMCWRAWQAWRLAPKERERRSETYAEHVGFTLIAYVVAFAIITGITTSWPWWATGVLAIAAVVLGRWAVGNYKRRIGVAGR